MNIEQIKEIQMAISNAIYLLYNEVESVCIDELEDEYNSIIQELENAQKIIEKELNAINQDNSFLDDNPSKPNV